MKRKRGNKKAKSKKHPLVGVNEAVSNVANPSTEDNSGLDDYDKDESDSDEMEAETPSSTGTDQQGKIASIDSGVLDKSKTPGGLVYGRVKVKIKTSKLLESQLTSSDAPTQSDTDKSSQQVGLEKQVVSEKMEDSANSLPETSLGVPANQSKKTGSIKIKSSRVFSSSSLSPCNNTDKDASVERSANEQKRGGNSVREYSPFSDNKASTQVQGEKTHPKDLSRRGPQQNKQELNAALEVIKKVMKMDAAEPFNVPVNPIALGIPDYFDVIDTPMDFGTICSNIENGVKYMNAEDVLKDVQFIWGNCYKYNNKGDYILELMKRVKKNFAKYWTAAGLSNEQMQGVETSQSKDAPSSQGKMSAKGGNYKHKTKKRQKVKRHKDDCLCAICVMMRRRQEREESAQINEDHNETSDDRLPQEVKPEDTSPGESPGGEGTSSSMDNSLDQAADADMEEKGEEVKREDTEKQQQLYSPVPEKQTEESTGTDNEATLQTTGEGEISEHSQLGERTEDAQYHTQTAELGGDTRNETRKEDISMQHVDETAAVEHQKPEESLDKIQRAKICENLRRLENPMLLELCGSLFNDNRKSLWRGPHSLIHRQGPTRSSPIHTAVATFMK